ncbi:hypothetical protein [Actinoplanes hulinensis]|nr:hypothetical protein [Actinoplanes hulinensis]
MTALATATLRKPFLPRELVSCGQNAVQSGHRDCQNPAACQ